MSIKKTKKLLFSFSLVVSAIPLIACDNGETPKEEPIEEPTLVVDSLKNSLIALNTTSNYTMRCESSRVAKHTRVFLKDSIGLIYDDNPSADKIFYQDGENGVYSVGFNGKYYVGSTYYNDISKDVWSGKFFSTMKDVETDFVNGVDPSVSTLKITNKAYRVGFLKTIGFSAIDYVDLNTLVASFNENKLEFDMNFRKIDIKFTFSNFGTSKNEVLERFLNDGGKPYEHNSVHDDIVSKMKMNNYEQYIYQFGETPETTGYIGKNYFHEKYYFTNYTGSLTASGHIALDGSESASGMYKDIYGCYPFYLDLGNKEQPLTLYPTKYYEEPDIVTFYNYPSRMSIWDHMEYLLDWDENIFDPEYDYKREKGGSAFVVIDPTLVYEIQDNFGIRSSFEGAIPLAVGIDTFTIRTTFPVKYEPYIAIVCKFVYQNYYYTMPFVFANFGGVSNAYLDLAIEEMKI